MLCKFDLQTLTDDVLATEGLVRTILDPMHESSLLMQLRQGLVALGASSLVCLGLGCKDAAVPGYQLLLLFHHGLRLFTAFLQIHLAT